MDKLTSSSAAVYALLRRAGLLLLGGAVSLPAGALEWSGHVQGGVTHTDNSRLAEKQKEADDEYDLASAIALSHRGSSLDFNADYALDYADYAKGTQDSSTELEGNSRLGWKLLPSLTWDVRHSRTTELANRRQVDTAQNRESRDLIATGPRLRLPVTDHDFLNGSAQLMQVRDDLAGDSAREVYSAGWTRLVSPTVDLTADFTRNDIDYDLSDSQDVKISRASLTGVKRYRLGRMEATLGRNKSERVNGETNYGGYYRGYVDYDAVGHVFSLAAVQELTDSSLGLDEPGFASSERGGVIPERNFDPRNSNFDVVDVVERRSIELNYSTQRLCNRCEVRARLMQDDQDFKRAARDEIETGARLSVDYRWSELFHTELSYARSKLRFLDDPANREDDTDALTLEARWQFSHAWWLVSELAHERRDSTEAGADYQENRIGLGVRYEFEHRNPMADRGNTP